jgi:putative nucleotidyltransferase with HDIG domain
LDICRIIEGYRSSRAALLTRLARPDWSERGAVVILDLSARVGGPRPPLDIRRPRADLFKSQDGVAIGVVDVMTAHAIVESELLRTSFARRRQRMASAERRSESVIGCAFLVAATALALIAGVGRDFSLPIATLFVVSMAIAGHIRFDVGAGFTVPTQVVFVPMLFAVPVALVPLLVALSLAVGMLPAVLRGDVPPGRMLIVTGNSWFAWGPALVILVTHDHRPDAHVQVLLLALSAQFVGDFLANVVRERVRKGISISELAGETARVYLMDAALAPVGVAVALAGTQHRWSVLLVLPLFGLLKVFSRERRERLEQLIELNDAYRGTALVLGDVVEADDTYTGQHCRGVVRLALEVADGLGLDAQQRRNVEFGALLHDVGKIAIPKEIINKPGKLDDREWQIIKTHTIEGQKMLERVGGFMREVGQIVRSSHERWDGGGYPDGLREEAIPLEARIVAACDAFNAMTTHRSYRRAMPVEDALLELADNVGTQFDPRVVKALARAMKLPSTALIFTGAPPVQ